MNNLIHPTAEVQSNNVGPGTTIWQHCVVLKDARIGAACTIGMGCFIENKVVIGNRVTLKTHVSIWDGITLGNNVFVGPNVAFTNDTYPRSGKHKEPERTYIKEGASIGANATILCGITIGEYAMIGAGAVVTKNVPARQLWVGAPARFHSHVCYCGKKIDAPSPTCVHG